MTIKKFNNITPILNRNLNKNISSTIGGNYSFSNERKNNLSFENQNLNNNFITENLTSSNNKKNNKKIDSLDSNILN